jgi:hypothetical protein
MSDRQMTIFKQLGGTKWLRELLDKKAPMPKAWYAKQVKLTQGESND